MKKLEKRVSAVLVAAGASTRMGFDKLSFDLGGETVLHRSTVFSYISKNNIEFSSALQRRLQSSIISRTIWRSVSAMPMWASVPTVSMVCSMPDLTMPSPA